VLGRARALPGARPLTDPPVAIGAAADAWAAADAGAGAGAGAAGGAEADGAADGAMPQTSQ
jgi:hypothetical protein